MEEKSRKSKKEKTKKTEKNKSEKNKKEGISLKKYFKKDTFLGITLAEVMVTVIVYVFVYMPYIEQTEQTELSISNMKEKIRELEEYDTNREQYIQETGEITRAIDEVLEVYPADAREEDILMLAVDIQGKNEIGYDSINMEPAEVVYAVEGETVSAAGIEGLDTGISFRQKHATYANTTTYASLKGCMEQILSSDNRIAIDNIVYVKNMETGNLEGNINLYFYSVQGTMKEYVAPDITEYIKGTDDIFGTDQKAAENNVDSENTEGGAGE